MACPINLANCKFHSASLIYPMAAANAALAFAFAFLAPGVFAVPTAQLGSSAPCAPGKACEVDGFVGTEAGLGGWGVGRAGAESDGMGWDEFRRAFLMVHCCLTPRWNGDAL